MERLLRIGFWVAVWVLVAVALHYLAPHHARLVSLLALLLLLGGIAVGERRAS